MNVNDRMRISDSDRDRVAAQLRDYYAKGRLTSEELDERVTAAPSAKTAGDLRRLDGRPAHNPSPRAGGGAEHTAVRGSGTGAGGAARGSCRVLLILFAALLCLVGDLLRAAEGLPVGLAPWWH